MLLFKHPDNNQSIKKSRTKVSFWLNTTVSLNIFSKKRVCMPRNGKEFTMRALSKSVTHQIDKMKGTYKGDSLEIQYQEIIGELDQFIQHYQHDHHKVKNQTTEY